MARTKGVYVTRGRGLELERELRQLERRLSDRVANAEALAVAASNRTDELLRLFARYVDQTRPAQPRRQG